MFIDTRIVLIAALLAALPVIQADDADQLAKIWSAEGILESAVRAFGNKISAEKAVQQARKLTFQEGGIHWELLQPEQENQQDQDVYEDDRWKDSVTRWSIGSKDVVVEVGANVGQWTVFFAKVVKVKHVYAVEPGSIAAFFLRWNVALNNISAIVTIQEAVCISDRREDAMAAFCSYGAGKVQESNELKPGDPCPWDNYNVGTVSLDKLVASVRQHYGHDVGLLKMNCEGCELASIGEANESVLSAFTHFGVEADPRDWDVNHASFVSFLKRICTEDIWSMGAIEAQVQEVCVFARRAASITAVAASFPDFLKSIREEDARREKEEETGGGAQREDEEDREAEEDTDREDEEDREDKEDTDGEHDRSRAEL